jgi:hypothetical protein
VNKAEFLHIQNVEIKNSNFTKIQNIIHIVRVPNVTIKTVKVDNISISDSPNFNLLFIENAETLLIDDLEVEDYNTGKERVDYLIEIDNYEPK